MSDQDDAMAGYDPDRLDGSDWRIGRAAFEAILSELRGLAPLRRILEFGSGESTRALSATLPSTQIVAVDQDPRFMARFGPGEGTNVLLQVAPLRRRFIGGIFCRTYDYRPAGTFDAVLVDGPTGGVTNGRLGALLLGFGVLRPGGLLFLDDCHRLEELRAAVDFVERTRSTFRFLEVGHGVLVFEKPAGPETAVGRTHAIRVAARAALAAAVHAWHRGSRR